jgi:hypothetical protein
MAGPRLYGYTTSSGKWFDHQDRLACASRQRLSLRYAGRQRAQRTLRRGLRRMLIAQLMDAPWPTRAYSAAVCVKSLAPVPDRAGPCAGFVVVLPPFELDHMDYGVDQRQVGEGLREVAKLLAAVRVDLLAIEIKGARE